MKRIIILVLSILVPMLALANAEQDFLPYDFTKTRYLIIYKNGYFQRYSQSPFALEKTSDATNFYYELTNALSRKPLTNQLLANPIVYEEQQGYDVILVSPAAKRHIKITEHWIADAHRKIPLSESERQNITRYLNAYQNPTTALAFSDHDVLVFSLQNNLTAGEDLDIDFALENQSVDLSKTFLKNAVSNRAEKSSLSSIDNLERLARLNSLNRDAPRAEEPSTKSGNKFTLTTKRSELIAKRENLARDKQQSASADTPHKTKIGDGTALPNSSLSASGADVVLPKTGLKQLGMESHNYKILIGILTLVLIGVVLLRRSQS